MPSALHKSKKYGTARRSGTLTKAFRGSARAWDSQRKSQGLLMKKPEQQQQQPLPVDDDDSDDSFALESPPESPLVERVVPVKQYTPKAASPIKLPESPIQDASTMPVELRSRRPLVQKPDNHLNQLPPSTPKNRKSYARRESKPLLQVEDVVVCHSIETEAVESEELVTIEVQEEVIIVEDATDDLPLPDPTPVRVTETFAVEIISSRRGITPPPPSKEPVEQPVEPEDDVDTAEDESNEEEEEEDDEDEVEIEEYDETIFLSPEKRGELHNEARRRGRAQGPALALNPDLITNSLRALNLQSPSTTPTGSIGQSEIPPTPAPVKEPKGLITPPPDEIPTLHPDSKVFTLLPVCDQQRIVTYTEYLQTISSDFSHIKKIGESSFAEVYIHKRDDGRSVVLKLVPLTLEANATEVLQELKTTRALSPIPGFIKYLGCQVVCSRIPRELDAAWRVWEENNNKDYNPTNRVFGDTEYHAIIALEDGGCSLEDTNWASWDVPLEIFRQTVSAFAQAEREREFEHRDLHSGNLLIRNLKREREGMVKVDTGVGRDLEIEHGGFEDVVVTLIDYTLSRAEIPEEFGGGVAYMEMEEGMFEAEGMYQFDIYRKVRDEVMEIVANANGHARTTSSSRRSSRINKPDWSLYCPRSNVIWLHFLIKRLIRSDDGRRNGGKLRVWKPSKAKKNEFDLACWGEVTKIHDCLDKEVDEGWEFKGAVDIERWCLENGVFEVLEREKERRKGGDGEVKTVGKEAGGEVRRSRRLRK
ncbi:hypothetical protein TWF281_007199 [Arthrobotrys megalospora]